MNYFLLFFSIFLETAKTVIANLFSKQELKEDRDIFKFNWIFYLGSFAILLCFPTTKPSLYTVLMAVGFAVVTTASQYFCLQALRCGPMSLTTFIPYHRGSRYLLQGAAHAQAMDRPGAWHRHAHRDRYRIIPTLPKRTEIRGSPSFFVIVPYFPLRAGSAFSRGKPL